MYRPLSECLTIKNSEIEGLGLFATQDIPLGTELGVSHIKMGDELIRTPLGGFYNYSPDPNVDKVSRTEDGVTKYYLRTIKNVREGDEITCDYTFYSITF